MPLVQSRFRPPVWLRNAHLQTVLPAILPRKTPGRFRRERLELDDGDYLDLDWLSAGHSRLVILSHGLEGSSDASYIRGMARALGNAGWDVLAWNFRGCSGASNRCLRFYHSGATDDLAAVITHAGRRYARIALAGFSLGGNITLKYLGERPPASKVIGAVTVSVPVDLDSCATMLDQRWTNILYRRRFLRSLRIKIAEKALTFPHDLDVRELAAIARIRDYDQSYTAPIHGFRDAADYYAQCSSRQFLRSINVPTLLINAADDPFLSAESFPRDLAANHPVFHFETPRWGGHVGFLDLVRGIEPWTERRAVEFLGNLDRSG